MSDQHRGPIDAGAMLSRIRRIGRDAFGVDLRALAALRIALGVLILIDVLGRWNNAVVHYTDSGLMPRVRSMALLGEWRWSVMLMNGSEEFVRLVFLVTGLLALCLIAGYRTRLVVVLLWVLVLSFHVRNPFLQNGGDVFLRLLLFWGMFLPLGAVWSIDSRRRRMPPVRWQFASIASAAVLFQIAFMYWFTAILKTGPEWRSDYTALWYSLGAGHLTTPFGAWLHTAVPVGALQVLTVVTLVVEYVAPVLLFLPFWNGRLRIMAAASLIGLQFGILATFHVGLFPLVSSFAMVVVLPAIFWDRGTAFVARARVRLLERQWRTAWPSLPKLVLEWISTPQALRMSPVGPDRDLGAAHAVPVGDRARSPGHESRDTTPSDREPSGDGYRIIRSSPVTNVVVSIGLVLALAWNITTVSGYTMPPEARQATVGLGLHQTWTMFAPRPPRTTLWYVLVGVQENGELVNVLPGLTNNDLTAATPYTGLRPANIGTDYYGDKYWRKYLAAIARDTRLIDQRRFGAYACTSWNTAYSGDQRLLSVTFASISERTLPDGERAAPVLREIHATTCA